MRSRQPNEQVFTAVGAGGWGFAEATLFFIVPDVLLTWVAIRGWRPGLWACAWALLGALADGLVMWVWGHLHAPSTLAVIELVPGISDEMIRDVGESMRDSGLRPIFTGPLMGVPYKIYAVFAGAMGISLALFMLASIPARAARFVVITLLAAGLSAAVGRRLSLRSKRVIHLILWAAFYAWYFRVMPN